MKQKCAIFGASQGGINAMTNLGSQYQAIAFIDNDKTKWGNDLAGVKIYGPESLGALNLDKVIIASAHSAQIFNQLTTAPFAFDRNNIIRLSNDMIVQSWKTETIAALVPTLAIVVALVLVAL